MNFFNKKIGKSLQGGFYYFEGRVIKNYPLIEISNEEQEIFIQRSKEISYLVSKFIKETKTFKERLQRTYSIIIFSKKLDKYYDQVCMLNQPYVKNPDQTVADFVNEHAAKLGENIVIRRFCRIMLGEVN